MSGFRKPGLPSPTRYKYIVNEEYGGKDKHFGSDFKYRDLLLANGPDAKDYTDISQVARNFYSSYSETLSKDLNPLYEMVSASGGMLDVEDNFVRWRVFGDPQKEMKSMGDPNASTLECVGVAGEVFKVRTDYQTLKIGDQVAPLRNKQCAFVIQSESMPAAGAYEYDAILVDPDTDFPREYLKAGEVLIKLAPVTSYLDSGQTGSFDFGMQYSYIEFEVPLHTSQWEYSVDEESWLKYPSITVDRCDEQNRPIMEGGGTLTNFMEVEAMNEIKRAKEYQMVYGRFSDHMVDKITQEKIYTAPGLLEYAEQMQEIPYSTSTNGIDQMVNELKAFWFDKVPVSQRKAMFYTGEGGLGLFHDWINEKYADTVEMSTVDLILGESTPFEAGRNGKSFGKLQFTKYYVPTFGEITVAHWPLLDNTRVNGVTMPGSYFPVSSFEFWAFNVGFGEPNIQMLTRNNKKHSMYIPGTIGPNGYVGPNNPIYKQPSDPNLNGYKWRHRESFGLVVMEPDRMVICRPNVAG